VVEHAHVVLTDYGQLGWGLTSPQLPHLVGGCQTYEELDRQLPSIVVAAGLDSERGRIDCHLQRFVEVGDLQVGVRVAQVPERRQTAQDLIQALTDEPTTTKDWQPGRSGDVLVVACVATDSMRWVLEQAGDQPVGIAFRVSADLLATFWAQATERESGLGPSLAELGQSVESTVQDVFDQVASSQQPGAPVRVPELV